MCAYLGFLVIVAFCYNVLYGPCDGFSDLLPVLLVFYATLGGLLFNFLMVFMFLAFKFSQWIGSFLAMFGGLRMTVLPLWWLLRACYVGRWVV